MEHFSGQTCARNRTETYLSNIGLQLTGCEIKVKKSNKIQLFAFYLILW